MSDTPRTDEMVKHGALYAGPKAAIDLCKTLERELAARDDARVERVPTRVTELRNAAFEALDRYNTAGADNAMRRLSAAAIALDGFVDVQSNERQQAAADDALFHDIADEFMGTEPIVQEQESMRDVLYRVHSWLIDQGDVREYAASPLFDRVMAHCFPPRDDAPKILRQGEKQ